MNSLTALSRALGLMGALAVLSIPALRAATFPADDVGAFTDRYCSSCHNDVDKEGGLDLTSVKYTPENADNFLLWVKIHDRVQAGEMPPKEKKRPAAADVKNFISGVSIALISSEKERIANEGRTMRRRLNRSEYESSLRDILQAPWLQVQSQLPEDGEAFRYNKVSTALDVSYVHMQRYMSAADSAMRQIMAVKLVQPPTTTKRYYARDEMTQWLPNVNQNAGGPERMKFPVLGYAPQPEVRQYFAPATVGESDPATRELEASGWISSNYVTGFGSRWSAFHAPVAGRYRIKFSGFTLWAGPGGHTTRFANGRDMVGTPRPPQYFSANFDDLSRGRRSEYITIYTYGAAQNRRLGGIDIHPDVGIQDLGDTYLLPNEGIVTDASRFFRSRPTGFQGGYTNPLAQRDGSPAVAFRWMEVEGPLYDDSTTAGYKLMFGDLPLKRVTEGTVALEGAGGGRGGRRGGGGGGDYGRGGMSAGPAKVEVESANPEQDAERLLRAFMARAYRRPVQESDVQLFLGVIKERLKARIGFAGAMLVGYTAVLASPQFVFVDEKPGRLDDYALATRLALFLWNSEPDEVLRASAAKGELRRPEVLKAQTDRMLADARSGRFVNAFLDYWLEIRKIEETTPSTSLYPDYYLDEALSEAAMEETRMFFTDLLQLNLPARNIVDSDFTYLNERLATHYGIPEVNGIKMRRVALASDSVRGGFMTHASVLKVTANGTTTSPVLRGKWIMERIVGYEIPPPPAAVPAVEPDIRGAVTIRQQLDKHRADESCAMCHRKIDPPGFALENFDVMGAWRDRYRATATNTAPERGFGKNGWPFAFYYALPADAAGQLADGSTFKDVREFKQLLLKDEAQIARNLAKQLTIYATGAPVRFGDREKIEQILAATKTGGYGVRSMVDQIIKSDLFLNK